MSKRSKLLMWDTMSQSVPAEGQAPATKCEWYVRTESCVSRFLSTESATPQETWRLR